MLEKNKTVSKDFLTNEYINWFCRFFDKYHQVSNKIWKYPDKRNTNLTEEDYQYLRLIPAFLNVIKEYYKENLIPEIYEDEYIIYSIQIKDTIYIFTKKIIEYNYLFIRRINGIDCAININAILSEEQDSQYLIKKELITTIKQLTNLLLDNGFEYEKIQNLVFKTSIQYEIDKNIDNLDINHATIEYIISDALFKLFKYHFEPITIFPFIPNPEYFV